MNQLLATFYVQSPESLYGSIPVTAQLRYQASGNWYPCSTSELITTVTSAHYEDSLTGNLRYRYKVDVFRVQTSQWAAGQEVDYYPLSKAGTYKRKLAVTFDNSFTLERMIYLTIQPDVHIYRESGGTQIDLVHTTSTVISPNPLVKQMTVNVDSDSGALAARNIALNEPNEYKETVFVQSNMPVDVFCGGLSVESGSYEKWLRLNESIRMTRKIGNTEYKWDDDYGSFPIIKTDTQNGKYVPFIAGSSGSSYGWALLEYPYYGAVELGLEKPLLELPIKVDSTLTLYGQGVSRYTGSGDTETDTAPVTLPLSVSLKTEHIVKLTPSILTLNEDNNYTSFIAVEANDGADWEFDNVDSRITVSPSSGTGRAAVIVKKDPLFDLQDHFINIPLTIVSLVDELVYPDIDGEYFASDTADVHLEQYTPTRNALIPKMDSNTSGGVTVACVQNDTAQELTGDYAAFAVTSEENVLTIDAGEPVLLDKIELQGRNIRRLVAASTYRGGAALAFSLYGTNDPGDVHRTRRTRLDNNRIVTLSQLSKIKDHKVDFYCLLVANHQFQKSASPGFMETTCISFKKSVAPESIISIALRFFLIISVYIFNTYLNEFLSFLHCLSKSSRKTFPFSSKLTDAIHNEQVLFASQQTQFVKV